jgi:hypothetical protein
MSEFGAYKEIKAKITWHQSSQSFFDGLSRSIEVADEAKKLVLELMSGSNKPINDKGLTEVL